MSVYLHLCEYMQDLHFLAKNYPIVSLHVCVLTLEVYPPTITVNAYHGRKTHHLQDAESSLHIVWVHLIFMQPNETKLQTSCIAEETNQRHCRQPM